MSENESEKLMPDEASSQQEAEPEETPSEILSKSRDLILPIVIRLKQLKKEFKELSGKYMEAYDSELLEKYWADMTASEKERNKLKQEKEKIEEGAKSKIKSRSKKIK